MSLQHQMRLHHKRAFVFNGSSPKTYSTTIALSSNMPVSLFLISHIWKESKLLVIKLASQKTLYLVCIYSN